MSKQQGLQQQSYREIHDGDGLSFNSDAMAAMAAELEAADLDVPADFNGRWIAWLQFRLDSDTPSLNGLLAEWAADEGTDNASAIGAFEPSAGGEPVTGLPNLSHAIHADLVFFLGSHPDGDDLGVEPLSESAFTTYGDAAFTAEHPDVDGWLCLVTTSTSADGAHIPLGEPFTDIGTVHTVWCDLVLAGLTGGSNIIVAPWTNTADWSTPFRTFKFGRSGFTTSSSLGWVPDTSTVAGATGPTGTFPTDAARKRLWVVRNGTNVKFGVGNAQVGDDVTAANGDAPNWGGGSGDTVQIFNRKHNAIGEGLQGTCLRLMVWKRALTAQELAALDADPLLGLL